MWFALIMFWHSLTMVHHIVLYWIVSSLAFFFCIYGYITGNQYSKWSRHHLYNQIDWIITWGVSVWNSIPDSGLLPGRVMVFSFFIIPVVIMTSSTMFMELGYSQNWFAVRLLFEGQHPGLILVIMISWSCSQSHQLLAAFIDLMDHGLRLPRQARVVF